MTRGWDNWSAMPAAQAEIPAGAAVHPPKHAGGCWGVVRTTQGSIRLTRPVQCHSRARRGRLTCFPHRGAEEAAQAARQRAEAAARGAAE